MLEKFKPLYKEEEEDTEEEEDDKFCSQIEDLQRYVKVLSNLTKIQIEKELIEFLNQLECKQLQFEKDGVQHHALVCDKELAKKYDELRIGNKLYKLLDNPTYIHAFKKANEMMLAIYQNIQQQAELHQTTL